MGRCNENLQREAPKDSSGRGIELKRLRRPQMNRYTAILMAGALVLAFAAPVAAQYDTQTPQATPSTEMPHTVMGTVVSVSATSLVIRTEGGDQMIFARDSESTIPATVGAGSAVRVEYHTPAPGTFHVSNVMIDASASGLKESSPSSQSTDPYGTQTGNGSDTMPKTASPYPVLAFVGLLMFAGGVTIRALIRH
jgi:hypothetical protein